MTDRLGQLFMMGIEGHSLTQEEKTFITKNNIGGIVLFGRNVESPRQLFDLCAEIQSLKSQMKDQVPFFIGIDMEGGRVARLKAPFTQWPAMAQLGKLDSTSLAFRLAHDMGVELKSIGINLNFAPCVDVLTNPQNQVIGDRSLGSDPEEVSKMASALGRGFIKSGIIACAKHFPGHGNTLLDSHEDLPIEKMTLAEIEAGPLLPFKKVFRARLDMVMTAHILFEVIDPQWPVTLSEKFLKQFLREELRYRALVISDDLDMKALRKNHSVETIAVQAMKAGCNLLLYCNEASSPPVALEACRKAFADGVLAPSEIEESLKKVLQLKKDRLSGPTLSFEEATTLIGHPNHLQIAKAVAEGRVPDDLVASH